MRAKDFITEYLSKKDGRKYLDMASSHDQTIFSRLAPSDTGCSRTILVSQRDYAQVIIVVKKQGYQTWSDNNSIVIPINGKAPFEDVDWWLNENRHLLLKMCKDQDIIDFLDDMKKYSKPLTEMVNLLPKQTGLLMPIFCDARDKTELGHDIRIKVYREHRSTVSGDNWTTVALRPTPHIVDGMPSLSKDDLEAVVKWINLNIIPLTDYIEKRIDTNMFKSRIVDINGVLLNSKLSSRSSK